MGTLITISQFILALAILVTLHELGHYLAARAFGIRVEKFYLFFDAFGFKLFKFKKGDTEYGIGWLPLGGYVKISGMIDESLDSKQLASAPEKWEFRSKPAWQRLIVMIGGVTVNLILGIGIFIALLWSYGESYIPNKIVNEMGGIYASPDARKMGLQNGDKIISLNGKVVTDLTGDFGDPDFLMSKEKNVLVNRKGKDTTISLPQHIENYLGKDKLPLVELPYLFKIGAITGGSNAQKAGLQAGDMIAEVNGKDSRVFYVFKEYLLENKGKEILLTVVTTKDGVKKMKANVEKDGTLGFQPETFGFEGKEVKIDYTLGQSITHGTAKSMGALGANIKAFGKVFTGEMSAKKSLGGPITIAKMFGAHWIWFKFWTLTAMLSLVLAFMNILPIPALDGGHVMFLLYEIITRRPVNEKVLYVGQIVGMVLLASLMVFIFWVDIARLFGM